MIMLLMFNWYMFFAKPFNNKNDQLGAVINTLAYLIHCYIFLSIQTDYLPINSNKMASYCIIGNIILNLAFHSSYLVLALIIDIYKQINYTKSIYLINLS